MSQPVSKQADAIALRQVDHSSVLGRYVLHPREMNFTSAAVAGDSPSNTELENGTNWSQVWENKNVRIVAIHHN